MSLSVTKSTQFKINELTIVTKGGPIDISVVYEEINLFDSLFMPVMSGNILINDSIGLANKLILDGSEYIIISISKDEENNQTHFDRTFRVVRISNRQNTKQNSETYILEFVSEEMVFSLQQKINQSYNSVYSDVVEKILTNQLSISKNNFGSRKATACISRWVITNTVCNGSRSLS